MPEQIEHKYSRFIVNLSKYMRNLLFQYIARYIEYIPKVYNSLIA